MGGFLDGIFGSGDSPEYKTPKMSDGDYKFIDKNMTAGLYKDSGDIQKELGRNTDTSGLLQNSKTSHDPVRQAIANKANQQYQGEAQRLKQQQSLMSDQTKFNMALRSKNIVNQMVRFDKHIDNQLRTAQAPQDMARSQVIGNILKIGMTLGGAYLGGAGGGAAANTVANAAAPSQSPSTGTQYSGDTTFENRPRSSKYGLG